MCDSPKLKCGCEPGYVQCPDAEALMEAIHDVKKKEANELNYSSYEVLKKELGKHFRENEVRDGV